MGEGLVSNHGSIETARLSIVNFSERHITDRYLAWLNDQEVLRFSDQRHRRHDFPSCKEYLLSFRDSSNELLAIIAKDSELGYIGTMSVYVEELHGIADLGIMIGERKAWGLSYGAEAWSAVCDHLFTNTNIRKITAGTIETNIPMIKLMKKVGMVEDGRRKAQCLWEGKAVDVIHAALYRKES